MATKNTYWIKLYTGLLDDPIYNDLDENTQLAYIKLYLLAKKQEENGKLIFDDKVLTTRHMAYTLHKNADELQKSINELVEAGYLFYEGEVLVISNYEDQQETQKQERERQQTKARVEKFRAKQSTESTESNESNEQDAEQNKTEKEEEKKRIEKNRIESNGTVTRYTSVTPEPNTKDISSSSSNPDDNEKPLTIETAKELINKILIVHVPETDKNWTEFIKFAVGRENKHKEKLEVYLAWAKENDYSPIYWTPNKMITTWPNAFPVIEPSKPSKEFTADYIKPAKTESEPVLSREEVLKRLRERKQAG